MDNINYTLWVVFDEIDNNMADQQLRAALEDSFRNARVIEIDGTAYLVAAKETASDFGGVFFGLIS